MDLKERIEQITEIHGGLRAAARATGVDAAYLFRLREGIKSEPSDEVLHQLGLRKEVNYVLQR